LPVNLSPRSHLFFTFLNVNVAKKKSDREAAKAVGYSILPIFVDGRIADRHYNVPVFTKVARPPYLLSLSNPDKATMMDPSKIHFSVRLELVSSVHVIDPYVNKFLKDGRISKSVREFLDSQTGSISRAIEDLEPKKKTVQIHPEEESKDIVAQIMLNAYRTGNLQRKVDNLAQGWKEGYVVLSKDFFRIHSNPFSNTGSKQFTISGDFGSEISFDKEKGPTLILASSKFKTSHLAASDEMKEDRETLPPKSMGHSITDIPPANSEHLTKSASSNSSKRIGSFLNDFGVSKSRLAATPTRSSYTAEEKSRRSSKVSLKPLDRDIPEDKRVVFSADSVRELYSWQKSFIHVKIRPFGTLHSIESLSQADSKVVIRYLPHIATRLIRLMMFGELEFDSGAILALREEYHDQFVKDFVNKCRLSAFQTMLVLFKMINSEWDVSNNEPLTPPRTPDQAFDSILEDEADDTTIHRPKASPQQHKKSVSPVLQHFSVHFMDLIEASGGYLVPYIKPHEALVSLWVALLQNRHHPDFSDSYETSLKLSHILFEMIHKSMVLLLSERGDLSRPPDEQETPFDDRFLLILCDLIALIADEVKRSLKSDFLFASTLNSHLAWFVKSCFLVIPKVVCFGLIEKLIVRLQPVEEENGSKCFLNVMRILFEDEEFIPLSCTSRLTKQLSQFLVENFESPALLLFDYTECTDSNILSEQPTETLSVTFSEEAATQRLQTERLVLNFVPVLMMSQLFQQLKRKALHSTWAGFLRDHFLKMDFDKRYQKGCKFIISSIYLPMIPEFAKSNQ
jgi:hypothetical protein